MIAEGGASIGVDLEFVLAPGVLRGEAAHCISHGETTPGDQARLRPALPASTARLQAPDCVCTVG